MSYEPWKRIRWNHGTERYSEETFEKHAGGHQGRSGHERGQGLRMQGIICLY